MSDSTFLDTNVLVYLFDNDEPVKQRRAREILESGKLDEFVLSTQVLSEFYVTVTRKLARALDPEHASEAIDWLGSFSMVFADTALVKSAIHYSRTAQLSYWDSLVVAAANRAGCARLLSEDLNGGQQIGTVRVENPFGGDE